jgi:outer membrane lipoprotein-sorting protein
MLSWCRRRPAKGRASRVENFAVREDLAEFLFPTRREFRLVKKPTLALLALFLSGAAPAAAAPAAAAPEAAPAANPPRPAKPTAQTTAVTPAAIKPGAKEKPAAKPDAKSDKPAASAPPAKPSDAENSAQKNAPPLPPAPPTREEALRRANEFLNASPVLSADFVQIGGDGKRAEGTLRVHRPGRMRFEYARPATMEVVSDGATVAVRDAKLNTQDLYFIDQTPLKFLLKEKISLENDVKVKDVVTDDSGTAISFEDKATFGGTSHIKLIFDSKTFALKQWQVTDPQGFETLITLFNIERMKAPDPNIFKVNR